MSARVVQRYVLDEIQDPRIKTYVVWGPMLGEETEDDAEEASKFLNDPRSTHFWTGEHDLAEMLKEPVGLTDELAWDVFLVFAPGVTWNDRPPKPDYLMHHGKSLPEELRLNGIKLREQVRRMLGDSAEGAAAAGGEAPH